MLATNAQCGQVLTASLTLNGDLTCTGDGLTMSGTAAIVLNLNGHVISGNGTGTGVTLSGKSETVQNGVISGFSFGVNVLGITGTVTKIRAVYNTSYGIVDLGTTTKLTTNVVLSSTLIGVYGLGSGSTYTGNQVVSNGLTSGGYGIYVNGGKTILTSNITNGNGSFGIYDSGAANTLTKNVANFNGNDGLYVSDLTVVDGAGNTAKGNNTVQGTEQCFNIVCS